MQGIPEHFAPDEYPATLAQEMDTARPRTPLPIYYFHDGERPFCNSPHCFCQRGKRAGAELYHQLATGKLRLAQIQAGTETVPIDIPRDTPEDCQLYGHSWQITEQPRVKVCSLCSIRGYCPGCTPVAPPGAKPFLCTTHTRQRQVQP